MYDTYILVYIFWHRIGIRLSHHLVEKVAIMEQKHQQETNWSGIDRRTVLKGVGAAGAIGMFGTGFTGGAVATNHENEIVVVGNIAFIPNSEEATVSKVDLDAQTAITRYSTLTEDEAGAASPSAWRVSRIDLDSEGNAWVPNSGTGSGGGNLQSSLVRIAREGGEPGVTTSDDHDTILDFDDEVRTQSWEIGGEGDMPRTVTVDENDDIWVGFYGGEYVQKYTYDEDNGLQAVGGQIDVPFTPYDADYQDGTLYLSCRDSSPFSGTAGVVAIDASTGDVEDLEYAPEGDSSNPYAVFVDANGYVWVSAMTNFGQSGQVRYLSKYDGVDWIHYDLNEKTEQDLLQFRGIVEYDGLIWVTADNGFAVGFDPEDEDVDQVVSIADGDETPPIGLAVDPEDRVWSILRSDGLDNGSLGQVIGDDAGARIGVGERPYAYGDFTIQVEVRDPSGCTPGFWKQPAYRNEVWTDDDTYGPSDLVSEVFELAVDENTVDFTEMTLYEALGGGGGPGVAGAQQILLRAATAGLLNIQHEDVNYPRTAPQLIGEVDAALATGEREEILALAHELDELNNEGCSINAFGEER